MKIVIPMSGVGKRFLRAGYRIPKPLINVDGKPIIEYVVNLFPGETDFIFICNKEHLKTTILKKVLNKLKPRSKIVEIEVHNKGPVYAVSKVFNNIEDEEEIIVSYCDFNAYWDYEEFKKKIKEQKFDGAIPSYIGFHPNLLHKKLYASILVDKCNFMTNIKEKHSFTPNPMDCYQSCGIYYFNSGRQLKKYFQELMDLNISLNDEFYVSMVYYLYKRDKLKVYVPEIKYFMQWGTPGDLEEYEAWSRYFAELSGKEKGITEIPKHRKVKIPWDSSSEEYKKSYKYWLEYFTLCKHNPNKK